MMFRYLGWTEAADLILKGLNGAIGSKRVTYDFARQMEGATEIKCSRVRRQHHRTCEPIDAEVQPAVSGRACSQERRSPTRRCGIAPTFQSARSDERAPDFAN